MTQRLSTFLLAAAALAGLCFLIVTGHAGADSTPIGPLPPGPTATVSAARGSVVAIALPASRKSSGLVWRLARTYDTKVVREVSEGDLGGSVVVLYKLTGRGTATVRYGLTRGDTSSHAVAARTFRITSR